MNEPTITVVGNVAGDPDLRYLPSGQPVCNFTIAVTPRTFDKQSKQWREGETMFYQCAAWRDYAEHCADTLHKGMHVICMGKLATKTFTDKTGMERLALHLTVEEVGPTLRFVTARTTQAQHQQRQAPQQQAQRGGWQADEWNSAPPQRQAPQQAQPQQQGQLFNDGATAQPPF